MTVPSVLDAAGRRPSPATMPGYHAGRRPRNKGERYPADTSTVDEIVAVMRHTGDDYHGSPLRALIVVLWRAGVGIREALALVEHDLDPGADPILARGGPRRRAFAQRGRVALRPRRASDGISSTVSGARRSRRRGADRGRGAGGRPGPTCGRRHGRSVTSVSYWQGMTFDPGARTFNFDGPAEGLWHTNATLARLAGRSQGIPTQVKSMEGWNHLGDLSYDATRARLLVPLECYRPGAPDSNTCKTGGIAVVDPVTLDWQYYVKLDPAESSKAMWAEVSPDGRWLWTSSGTDLLAYDASQISAANAGPGGTPLRAVKRVAGALRASSLSRAAFDADRLYLAYDRGTYTQELSYPVDAASGEVGTAWRLEPQRTKTSTLYETEGWRSEAR